MKRHKLLGIPFTIDMFQEGQIVLVDVFAVFFRFLMKAYIYNHTTFASFFWNTVKKFFDKAPPGVIFKFVVDGKHSVQKEMTTIKREAGVNEALAILGGLLELPEWKASHHKQYKKNLRKAFRISQAMRQELVDAGKELFKDDDTRNVILADGEADVYLSKRGM